MSIMDEVGKLIDERESLIKRKAEIDEELHKVYEALGRALHPQVTIHIEQPTLISKESIPITPSKGGSINTHNPRYASAEVLKEIDAIKHAADGVGENW